MHSTQPNHYLENQIL